MRDRIVREAPLYLRALAEGVGGLLLVAVGFAIWFIFGRLG